VTSVLSVALVKNGPEVAMRVPRLDLRCDRAWYPISMRLAALFTLLSLVATPIAGAACGVECSQVQPQAAKAKPAFACHERNDADGVTTLVAGRAACHDGSDAVPAATVAERPGPGRPATLAPLPSIGFARGRQQTLATDTPSLARGALDLATIPLRI
jgi:hypothetical protein